MKNTSSLLISVLLLLFCLNIQAQSTGGSDIVSFKDKLLLKGNINTQSESFSIVDSNERFTIEALNSFRLQVAANYKFLGLSFAFSPVSRSAEFKSKFFEAQLRFFIKKQWIQSFKYSNVKGFYEENVSTNTIARQFPNLQTQTFSGSTAYVFNTNFSLNHLENQNEWQQYTAGSFIPSLKYGLNNVSDLTTIGKISRRNIDISLAASYYYTWCILENWFISPNVSPELGIRFSKNKTPSENNKEIAFTRALNVGLQFGFTNNNISAGAKFSFNSNKVSNNSSRNFTNDKNFASLYFGYRIKPPKFIENTVNSIEDRLGL